MASPYYPVESTSPLDQQTTYRSAVTYSDDPIPAQYGDLGLSGIEMEEHMKPDPPKHTDSTYSTGTLFPSKGSTIETQSFLHDPANHIDTFYTSNAFVPYKDNSGRQLKHLLVGGLGRFFITVLLCGGYILATRIWQYRNAQTEGSKRMYNTITTAISIAMGLNIASAFKDMALNMRWPILHARKRNLVEVDIILHADSLTAIAKLVYVTRRPMVIFCCILWLLANLLAQSGIAMLSLTYGFDPDTSYVRMDPGNVTIPKMDHFYPQGNSDKPNPTPLDEMYTAHMYGEFAWTWGVNDTAFTPSPHDVYMADSSTLFQDYNNSRIELIFLDAPPDSYIQAPATAYSNRTINMTYVCSSHKVLAGGDGSTGIIQVEGYSSNISVSETVLNTTAYFTAYSNECPDNARCSTVQAFESSKTSPWYYECNITLGQTQNDSGNISFISDFMAYTATSAIAQNGITDPTGQSTQLYPQDSEWGIPLNGSAEDMGMSMATFGLGSLAGAVLFNPTTSFTGSAPNQGVVLHVNHPKFFYLIIGLILGFHLLFLVIVSVLANRVMVGPDGHLSMSMMLRPIADALEGVSGGKENAAFRNAKRNTMVKYEKTRSGKWHLNMQ